MPIFTEDRLGLTFDWYQKMTRDWLLTTPIPAVYGLNAPAVNGGDVMNTGVELALNWDDFVGDFRYGISLSRSPQQERGNPYCQHRRHHTVLPMY